MLDDKDSEIERLKAEREGLQDRTIKGRTNVEIILSMVYLMES
jgi:hypothetical protein